MKRLISLTAILALVAAIVGPGLLMQHIKGVRDGIVKFVHDAQTDEQLVAQAEQELKDHAGKIREFHLQVEDLGDKSILAKAQADKIEKQIEGEKKILARIKQSLDSSDNKFEISGRIYTRAEIEKDGQIHLTKCAGLEKQLDSQRKLIAELDKALADGRKFLADAKQIHIERTTEIETLKVRLANGKARGEISRVSLTPPADDDAGKKLADLNDRVKKRDRGIDYDSSSRSGDVDWTPKSDVRDAIGKYLKPCDTSAQSANK